jgi:hypothetical protein
VPPEGGNLYHVYVMPSALLVILAVPVALAAAVAGVAVRRTRRRRGMLRAFDPCLRCGFDMRATTGPCPECGTARPKPRPKGGPEPVKPEPVKPEALFDDFEDEPWHVA